jgi:4-diphosphocytidyl-2-C-methyl-D-erythritol kinase
MLSITAYAKINLLLDVLHKRPDGFHELSMVMQSVSLADTLNFSVAHDIQITTNKVVTEKPEQNLVYRAIQLLQKDYPQVTGAKIYIDKQIPLAAGLAGGSADCAAALEGMNILYGLRLTKKQLEAYANKLGSDITFCLYGGTQLATGRGEILTRLPSLPKFYGLILKPPFSIATAAVYKSIPAGYQGYLSQTKLDKYADAKIDRSSLGNNLSNTLYSFACQVEPDEEEYVALVKRTQPLACQMSGSGPSIFAFYTDIEARNQAISVLKDYEVYAIETIGSGLSV